MFQFQGKTAIVTGASTGIGRATALAFAKAGAQVVVADINKAQAEETAQMASKHSKTIFVSCDVSSEADQQKLLSTAVKEFGRIDCAFNNAGIEGQQGPLHEGSLENFNRVISVNLTGVWLGMKYQIAQMIKQGSGGAIVNNASILGWVGFAGASPYTASKHGVLGMTKVAAIEYATQKIRVNAVCPGFIVTPMLERAGITSNAEMKKVVEALHPMKRMGTAEEIADATLWLCSDKATFVTGVALPVDGGYLTQ